MQANTMPTTQQADISSYLERNEQGDAEFFTLLFKGGVVYDHSEGIWYIWRGQYWEPDETNKIVNYVSNYEASLYISFASEEMKRKGKTDHYDALINRANRLQSLTRTKHVLEFATSQDGIGIIGDEWDLNLDILPANNGVIDLITGEFRNASPTEYIRNHCPVDWIGLDTPCPIWENTLRGIFSDNQEMVDFIQRLFGYAITGHVTENKLPIFIGEHAQNGKTTIFEVLGNIFGGDLATSLPMKTLMKSDFENNGNAPEPYLVTLKGKRLAYSSESAEDMKLDTAIVKKLTGGDTLNPRGMYEKVQRGFKPTHKLMLFTNHKPIVPPDDYGAWERIMLIELKVTFKNNPTKPNERQKDVTLKEKLKAEYSGILAWLVRGCLEWRKQGLNPPAFVMDSTTAYKAEEDDIQIFVDECLDLGAGLGTQTKSGDIYKRYKVWAEGYGMKVLQLNVFGKRAKDKIGEPLHTRNGNFYQNVKIR